MEPAALRGLLRRQVEAVRRLEAWWGGTRVVMSAEEAHEVANVIATLVALAELAEVGEGVSGER